MIEQWLNDIAPEAPYLIIFGVLLLTGFGLPLPEDIPLMLGGYLCGASPGQQPYVWIMIPGCMISIVLGDTVLYGVGRWAGPSIHRHPIVKRLIGTRNLARARVMFKRRGGRFVFTARFLPGVRAPAFFTAGSFKMPFTQFLMWNGSAAMFSVPWVVLLAYYFHGQIEYFSDALYKGKSIGITVAIIVVGAFVAYHVIVAKRFARVDRDKNVANEARAISKGD